MVVLLWAGQQAAAQNAPLTGYGGYTHLGVYESAPAPALAFGANAGALPLYKNLTATAYGEKRFLLDDLSLFQIGLVIPMESGAFGLQAAAFGSAAYNQSRMGLAYGHVLNKKLSIGVQFNYQHHHISGYGNAGAVGASAGVVYRLSQNLHAGLQVDNPAGSAFYKTKTIEQPRTISAGGGYAPSPAFYIQAIVVKEEKQHLDVHTGLQYTVLDKLQVKGGWATATSTFYFGVGYTLGVVQVDGVASFHPQLGISPGIMVTLKKEKD